MLLPCGRRRYLLFLATIVISLFFLLLFAHKILSFHMLKRSEMIVIIGNTNDRQKIAIAKSNTNPKDSELSHGDTTSSSTSVTSPTFSTVSPTSLKSLITGRPGPTNVPIVVCGDRNNLVDVKDIFESKKVPRVELFITILTAPHQFPRRMAIRDTWLSTARNYSVAYRFFTDGKELAPEVKKKLDEEQRKYKDLEFLPTKGGYWFSHRYLHALFWASKHYSFNFYLRMDDDYFLCLNNLYNDLQYRKKEKLLYWGNMCCWPSLVAMDEGFVILGTDLLQEIVRRNNSLCCHPMGGQMIAMWVNRLDHEGLEVTYFQDNERLKHYRNQLKGIDSNLCMDVIGIHESYPKEMHEYWNVTKDSWFSLKSNDFLKVKRKEYWEYCSRPKGWDWRALNPHWKHEPKPCWAPGVDWPELHSFKFHKGRE